MCNLTPVPRSSSHSSLLHKSLVHRITVIRFSSSVSGSSPSIFLKWTNTLRPCLLVTSKLVSNVQRIGARHGDVNRLLTVVIMNVNELKNSDAVTCNLVNCWNTSSFLNPLERTSEERDNLEAIVGKAVLHPQASFLPGPSAGPTPEDENCWVDTPAPWHLSD